MKLTEKLTITNEDNGCIYKITNPKGRVYIGQTIDIKTRLSRYKRNDCKKQLKLFNSLNKYGYEAHKFEIIHVAKVNELNNLERFYQDAFSSVKNGLNIRLTKSTDRKGTFSEETKLKMSIAKKGKKRSAEVRKAISDKMKQVAKERSVDYYYNFSKSNVGRKHTEEHKQKNSNAKKGNKFRSNASNKKDLH